MEQATEEKALVKSVGIDTSLTTAGGLIPQNLDQLWRLACMMAKSGMMPTGIQTPEAVAVAVQMGLEVGLSPMSAVQNIAVINGRPSIWGDSVLGLVRASGLLEDFNEYFEGEGDSLIAICKASRKDQKTEIVRTFSVADAKKAKLWGVNVWEKYPKRMLQMRARSWTLRDGFGDVIKGLRVAEEVIDMVTANGQSFGAPPSDAASTLNEKLKADKGEKASGDPYATKPEAKKDEDPIRAEYINLKKTGFKPWVMVHLEAIPTMPKTNQIEIREKWFSPNFFPGEPYPLDTKEVDKRDEPSEPPEPDEFLEGILDKGDDLEPPPITEEKPPDPRKNSVPAISCPFADVRVHQEPLNDPQRVYATYCEDECKTHCSTYTAFLRNIQSGGKEA